MIIITRIFWLVIWRYCKTSCHISWLFPRSTSNYWWSLTAAQGAHQKPGFDWWRSKCYEYEKIRATLDVVMWMSAKGSVIVPKLLSLVIRFHLRQCRLMAKKIASNLTRTTQDKSCPCLILRDSFCVNDCIMQILVTAKEQYGFS